MQASYISKDQNYQNETTTYWFDVDGETFGVSEQWTDQSIVDAENYPVNTDDAKNVHLQALKSLVTDEIRQAR